MKTNFNFKRVFGLVGLFLLTSITVIAQQGFCQGNYFTNGDFEIGIPTNQSNNITLADGWDKIWNGNSEGDYYDQNSSAVGTTPNPQSGDYGSLWITNEIINNATWREGMLNELTTTIPMGSGTYDFTFDIACLNGYGNAEIGIYAVYDPNAPGPYVYPNAPTTSHLPTNLNLYSASGLPQEIELLGTVPVPDQCNGTRSTETFIFDSNILSLSGDITHIVVMASSNVTLGRKYVGLDNFCMIQSQDQPTPDGSYCCDESDNLVQNGNFEYGNTGFGSDYTQNGATLPGQYDVTTSAAAFGANITDHSFCEDPTLYSTNDKFLLVNGKTTQPAGTTSEIWRKSLNLDGEKEYRFCANFKNMPQCTFDILPEIEITTNTGYSATAIIDVDPNDPCDWQTISFCFKGDEDMDFKITLKEDSLGDGNDLAIDDIAVSELIDPELAISVLHQGNPQQITGSFETIATSDDILPYDQEVCDEPYFWWVITLLDTTGGTWNIDTSAPYGWGNNTGHNIFNGSGAGSATWDLTTNFPVYPFAQNTLYLIGMTTPSCCEDCVDEGLTYQIVYNNRMANISLDSNDADLAWIRSWLGTFSSTIGSRTQETGANRILETPFNGTSNLATVKVYPNPARNMVTVSLLDQDISTIVVFTTEGKQAMNQQVDGSRSKQLDVSSLAAGMYLVQITAKNNQVFTSKLIIE